MEPNKISISQLPCTVIEPSKAVIDDFEIIAFDREDDLNFYTVWHETLYDKRREINAESERERQVIRNEIVRKTQQFLLGSYECSALGASSLSHTTSFASNNETPENKPVRRPPSSKSRSKRPKTSTLDNVDDVTPELRGEGETTHESSLPTPSVVSANKSSPALSTKSRSSGSRDRRSHQRKSGAHIHIKKDESESMDLPPPYLYPPPSNPNLPNGLTILNSTYYNTLPAGKGLMKYKLTKLYNKLRGRQMRRNYVVDKHRAARLESEVSKSYLNSWLAYSALQAVRLPEPSKNQLSTIAINNNPRFITIPQVAQPAPPSPSSSSKKESKNSKKQNPSPQQSNGNNNQVKPPMHLVYIDPNDIVTYSNKINPQQIASYRKRPQVLPTSATSKKSSAASYDVYEIMEVLANSDKTNVTITRNANRPAPRGQSIFSRSVNANTPGIVSTQLHLQAKSYLDSVGKFYSEEAERVAREEEELKNEPSVDEQIQKYIKIFWPNRPNQPSGSMNSSGDQESMDLSECDDNYDEQAEQNRFGHVKNHLSDIDDDDEINKLETDILSLLNT